MEPPCWAGQHALLMMLLLAASTTTAAAAAAATSSTETHLLRMMYAVNITSGDTNLHASNVIPNFGTMPGPAFDLTAAEYFVVVDDGEHAHVFHTVEHRGHLGPIFYDIGGDSDDDHIDGHVVHTPPQQQELRYYSVSVPHSLFEQAPGRRRQTTGADVRLMRRGVTTREATVAFTLPFASARDGFQAQAVTTPAPTTAPIAAELIQNLQTIDTTTQPTLVFLSAGYMTSERSTFLTDVNRAIKVLSDTSSDAAIDATPWPRYASLLNIFAVFQSSTQSGASVQVGPGFECNNAVGSTSTSSPPALSDSTTSPSCIAKTVDNNLGCAYGSPQPRLLSCDYSKVFSLASNAPAADVIIVLVNSGAYGGTGMARGSGSAGLAVLSTGADLPFLLVHELNHALSGLGDEYTYGYSEPNTDKYNLPNCNANLAALPWQPWISQGLADSSPSLGCSFDNFYRPTADSCLMREKVNSMCSVCRQATTLAIATKAANRPSGIGLAVPRCPPAGFIITLQSDQSTTLSINHYFATFNTNVTVRWVIPQASGDSSVILNIPSVFIRASDLPVGLKTITATITDSTNYILSSDRSGSSVLTEVATFQIQRLPDGVAANCTAAPACTSTSGSVNNYCGSCSSGTCSPVVNITVREYTAVTADSLSQSQAIVNGVAVGIVIGGVVIVVAAIIAIVLRRWTKPSEILVLSTSETVLGVVAGVFDFCSFGLSCACIIVMTYYLPRVPVFGLDLFIGVFVFAAVVYITSAVAFCSLVGRAVVSNIVSGVLMAICAVGTFVICAIGFWVVINNDSDDMKGWFRDEWKSNVADHPDRVCSLQYFLHCSGFDAACFPAPSSWCPANCDYQNRNANACYPVFQLYVRNTLLPFVIVGLIFTFILVTGGSLTVAYGVSIDRLRKTGKGRRSYRHDPRAPVVSITDAELRAVELEFTKADKDHDGKLQGAELINFLRAVFAEECSAADVEALNRASMGPDGAVHGLSLDQILDVYFPTRSGRPDPRLLTDEEAEDATSPADLVRKQFNKMENFMQASGALSPEQMYQLHEAYIRNNAGDDGTAADFLHVVKKAAKQHSTSEAARMCQGLTYNDLEGLRCAWVRLHPAVVGPLTKDEIGTFFSMTHDGSSFVSQEHYVRWMTMLDVRKTGSIGWPEFCFPFAQRALLRNADQALMMAEKTYELRGQPAFMTREEVAEEYGHAYVAQCFLPYEKTIPIARVLAASLPAHARRGVDKSPIAVTVLNSHDSGHDNSRTYGQDASLYSPRRD